MVLLALLAPHPSFHALDVAVLALLALAGIAVLMFFRDRGWHPAGGIVAALAFAFGASAAWRIQHIGQIESFVFFAVTLWLLARALDRASVRYGLAAGIAGALMLMQPDQVAFLAALFLAGFVRRPLASAGAFARRAARDRQAARRGVDRGCADHRGAGPAHRAVRRIERPRGVAYAEATRGSLHPASLLTLLVGGLFSPDYAVPLLGAVQRRVGSQAPVPVAEHEPALCRRAADPGDPDLRHRTRHRLDARGALLSIVATSFSSSTRSAATRRSFTSSSICCPA